MAQALLPEGLASADRRLVEVGKTVRVLSSLEPDKSAASSLLSSFRAGKHRLPTFERHDLDLSAQRAALEEIIGACDLAHPVGRYLRETAESYLLAARMVEAAGTEDFVRWSRELYGGPDSCLPDQATTVETAARELMIATEELTRSCRLEESEYCVLPEQVAEQIRREALPQLGGHAFEVRVDDGLSAKAAAGATGVRLRGGTCFTAMDAAQLLQHEALVHSLTAINGRAQPQLKSLSLGAPRTTQTQEGIATFAELITNVMDVHRLRRICSRVVATALALDGADAFDLLSYFLESGQTEEESAHSTQRLLRGGDARGRNVFTKDVVYLRGFVEVHDFLRRAVRSGNLDWPARLFAGRLTTTDVELLGEAFDDGLIARPALEPTWSKNRSTLVTFLVHSEFAAGLHLGALGRHVEPPT